MPGGRPKGALNKVTKDIREAAQKHGPAAIKKLAALMDRAESEQAQVAAAKELLDRGYGKSTQPIEGEVLHDVSEELRQFIAGNATASRSFVGFADEDQDQKAALNGGPVPHHR